MTDDQRFIYAFQRNYLNEKIIVVLNNSDRIQSLNLKVEGKHWIDLITGDSYAGIDGKVTLKIDIRSGMILASGQETRFAGLGDR